MAAEYHSLGCFPCEWPVRRIGDFASVKGGKRLPLGTSLIPTRTSHPYIRIVDLRGGRIDKSNLMYVPDDVFPCIARYTISSKDIYISIVGTIGLVGVVGNELDGANLTENAAKICNIAQIVERDYLSLFLRSGWGQYQIDALTVGSTQPKLALFRVEDIRVPVPPVAEQRAFAQILGALDEKIELNRQMNETLEAIARAIFKSWFVDFDPVHAKVEGRWRKGKSIPGLPAYLYDLFPGRLVDSELGGIPEGWATWQLKNVLIESNVRIGEQEAPEYSSTNVGLQLRSERFKKSLSASSAMNKVIRKGFLVFGLSRRILNFGLMRDPIGSVSSAYKVFEVNQQAVSADLSDSAS